MNQSKRTSKSCIIGCPWSPYREQSTSLLAHPGNSEVKGWHGMIPPAKAGNGPVSRRTSSISHPFLMFHCRVGGPLLQTKNLQGQIAPPAPGLPGKNDAVHITCQQWHVEDRWVRHLQEDACQDLSWDGDPDRCDFSSRNFQPQHPRHVKAFVHFFFKKKYFYASYIDTVSFDEPNWPGPTADFPLAAQVT